MKRLTETLKSLFSTWNMARRAINMRLIYAILGVLFLYQCTLILRGGIAATSGKQGILLLTVITALLVLLSHLFAKLRNAHFTLTSEAGEALGNTEQTWKEYPRPQLKRDNWYSLNGIWQLNGHPIRVPFPPQSALSGYTGKIGSKLTYTKTFRLTKQDTYCRTLLHFGAVDQIAEVFLNGIKVGSHTGGYLPFTFDISTAIRYDAENILTVQVIDTLSESLPYGKQKKDRGGMWYTPVSGIWQSVWLEQVPDRYITELKIGEQTTIAGWIEKIREQKTMFFIVLSDITGMIQVSIEKEKYPEIAEKVKTLTKHSVVKFTGKTIKAEYVKLGGVEFIPEKMEIESIAKDLPIQEESSKELKMDYRWIELRDPKQKLIFQIRTFTEYVMREFFISKGFIEIHSPKITALSSEGGAEVFRLDYYGEKAYLTQSPQLYKQMAIASGFDKVFEIGTQYRAENSYTARHASESVALDFEIAHITSHHDIMDVEEEFFIHLLTKIKEKYGKQIEDIFGIKIHIPQKQIPRIKLCDVFKIFKDVYGIDVPSYKQLDLTTEQEKLICEYCEKYLDSESVFITDYPSEARAFYSKKIEGTVDCMAFDFLYRGWEMNSGAVREHRYEELKGQIEENGISSEKMKQYLEFFKYGCPTHGGIGFGIDRFIAKLLGLSSIKESIFLFRGPSRLKP